MHISIEEPRPRHELLAHTGLRAAIGGAALAHATVMVLALGLVAGQFDTRELAIGAAEGVAGLALMLGFWSRTSALLVVAAAVFSALPTSGLQLSGLATEQGPWLRALAGAFFVCVGGGRLSLDAMLRERARLRAIAEDDRWLYPPYVAGPAPVPAPLHSPRSAH